MRNKTVSSEYLGYRDPEYAFSLAEFGRPLFLKYSAGWALERAIPLTNYRDVMGLYPLYQCKNWISIQEDLNYLRNDGVVSLVLVSDPMLSAEDRHVFSCFDIAKPFKTHYLSDLNRQPADFVSQHHRYYVRKAAKELAVEISDNPAACLDEWHDLYASLMRRYEISDLRVFSRESFQRLLSMPGVVLFRAYWKDKVVGAQIILIQGSVAFAHLAAFTDMGYKLGASYLLDWCAMEFLHGQVRYVNWGGGKGMEGTDSDGLGRYKEGWATDRMTSYLLGSVLDRQIYAKLTSNSGMPSSSYFPLYRAGEFG